eukprot:1393568-Rhodomonas_salina.1
MRVITVARFGGQADACDATDCFAFSQLVALVLRVRSPSVDDDGTMPRVVQPIARAGKDNNCEKLVLDGSTGVGRSAPCHGRDEDTLQSVIRRIAVRSRNRVSSSCARSIRGGGWTTRTQSCR